MARIPNNELDRKHGVRHEDNRKLLVYSQRYSINRVYRMARLPRFNLPGCPQYVIQRGNNRQDISMQKETQKETCYRTGNIDKTRMRDLDSVQPQCPTCSPRQRAEMSRFSRQQKKDLGL